MSQDVISWEILEDGTISLKTPGISGENHVSADELLETIAKNVGGEVKIEKLKPDYKPKMVHGHHHHVHH
jgi:hypothetical protein